MQEIPVFQGNKDGKVVLRVHARVWFRVRAVYKSSP